MSRRNLLLLAAAAAFVLGWVLPVIDDYVGWHAFRVALSPIWPYENFGFEAWYSGLLTVASALTNVVFLLVLADVVFWRRLDSRVAAWLLLGAFVLNLHWFVRAGSEFTMFRVGYYLWLASFLLLALAARTPNAAGR